MLVYVDLASIVGTYMEKINKTDHMVHMWQLKIVQGVFELFHANLGPQLSTPIPVHSFNGMYLLRRCTVFVSTLKDLEYVHAWAYITICMFSQWRNTSHFKEGQKVSDANWFEDGIWGENFGIPYTLGYGGQSFCAHVRNFGYNSRIYVFNIARI